MAEHVLLIMNPNAGQKRGKRYLADILSLFREYEYRTTVMMTKCRGDAVDIIKQYGKDADKIVCIGGDGTFNETVNGVLQSGLDVPIGYIPAGSTNDFANSLKLPKNMVKAAQKVCAGTPQNIDIGRFNEQYFSYVASFGAFTKTSYTTPQSAKNTLGHLAYLLEGIKDIPNIRPLHLRIETENETFEGEYLFGAISNSTSVGGVLTLDANHVDMNDGKFELLLIKSPSNATELNEIVRALTPQNGTYPSLVTCTASRLQITADATMDWTLDGEHAAGSEHILIENLHSAIRLLL